MDNSYTSNGGYTSAVARPTLSPETRICSKIPEVWCIKVRESVTKGVSEAEANKEGVSIKETSLSLAISIKASTSDGVL